MIHLLSLLYTLCIFISALLLFSVQPLMGKMVLPLLGGTPQVWNTCMFFFQLTLLAGYYYVHVISALRPRWGALIHVTLLAFAVFFLPAHPVQGWTPPGDSGPVFWLLLLLTVTIGLPFLVLSANSPLIQKWFSYTRHPDREDPYFLYAASNAGSLAALLSYPFLIEPAFSLSAQTRGWSLGFIMFAVLLLICLIVFMRSAGGTQTGQALQSEASAAPAGQVPWRQRLWWVFLAFVPASLMYGVTTYLSTDIAAFPLLWIIPLSIYLLTFIFAFAKRTQSLIKISRTIFPLVVIPLVVILAIGPRVPMKLAFGWNLFSFFVMALFCHGTLAASRPRVKHLTEFYLWLSVGGVLGGAFNTLLAPVLFKWPIEYQVAVIGACLIRTDRAELKMVAGRWIHKILPAAFGLFVIAGGIGGFYYTHVLNSTRGRLIFLGLILLVVVLFRFRKGRQVLGILSILFMGILFFVNPNVEYSNRSFFGVHRVKSDYKTQLRSYLNGRVVHGVQSLDPKLAKIPSTYYHPSGPAGDIIKAFRNQPDAKKVAIVGLGIGSMAAYGKRGEEWTFYEIDPVVNEIANNSRFFTYLKDTQAQFRVVLGDGRLNLAKAPDEEYDLIVIDAFSSDAIPTHLLTKEAINLYARKLSQTGILTFHISNQYVDLEPVLSDLGASIGLMTLTRRDIIDEKEEENAKIAKKSSIWLIMIKEPSVLGLSNIRTQAPAATGGKKKELWTDDFSNIVGALRWS